MQHSPSVAEALPLILDTYCTKLAMVMTAVTMIAPVVRVQWLDAALGAMTTAMTRPVMAHTNIKGHCLRHCCAALLMSCSRIR